jgi:hypothetical protein
MKYRANNYVQDPLDQWFEDHPLAGGLLLGLLGFALLFLACLL